MGLHRAGFDMTGVDINPQPRYPFKFIQGDAMEQDLNGFDFVWASPPCQHYSGMSGCRDGLRETYPDLIGPVRDMLTAWGGPWIIENVMRAPLRNPVMLCGAMFGQQPSLDRSSASGAHNAVQQGGTLATRNARERGRELRPGCAGAGGDGD